MKEGKLSFLASERFFKKGAWRRFYPPLAKKIRNRTTRYAKDNYYILCLGAFLSRDVSLLGFPLDKCYKWGYFPEVDFSDGYESRDNNRLKILWTGRMLDWKRADTALKACRFLNKVGVDFQLDFIGEGEESDKLKALSEKYRLRDKVNFLGSMPPESVRKAMSKSDSIQKYAYWGLLLFVGIPLPGTGAWTGALIASLLNMDIKKSFVIITIGVIMAGLIITTLSYGLLASIGIG